VTNSGLTNAFSQVLGVRSLSALSLLIGAFVGQLCEHAVYSGTTHTKHRRNRAGIASLPICWYFNVRYVYGHADNPFWGQGDWSEFIKLGYANPAASSASADYTIGNVILLPLFTIIDGRRRGINRPWLFFVSSLFTSFAFAWAFYLATAERQHRHQQAAVIVDSHT
jgi:Terpene cyclase DEP1